MMPFQIPQQWVIFLINSNIIQSKQCWNKHFICCWEKKYSHFFLSLPSFTFWTQTQSYLTFLMLFILYVTVLSLETIACCALAQKFPFHANEKRWFLCIKQNKHQFRKSNEDNNGFHDWATATVKQSRPNQNNHKKGWANDLRASLYEHRIHWISKIDDSVFNFSTSFYPMTHISFETINLYTSGVS